MLPLFQSNKFSMVASEYMFYFLFLNVVWCYKNSSKRSIECGILCNFTLPSGNEMNYFQRLSPPAVSVIAVKNPLSAPSTRQGDLLNTPSMYLYGLYSKISKIKAFRCLSPAI